MSSYKSFNHVNKFNTHSGWHFYTHVNPLVKTENPQTKAFEIFIADLLLSEEFVKNELHLQNTSKIIRIDTTNDNIAGTQFLKSVFLLNHNFKQRLVDYYNPLGIFVRGPDEIIKRDGTSTKQWILELSPIKTKYRETN